MVLLFGSTFKFSSLGGRIRSHAFFCVFLKRLESFGCQHVLKQDRGLVISRTGLRLGLSFQCEVFKVKTSLFMPMPPCFLWYGSPES